MCKLKFVVDIYFCFSPPPLLTTYALWSNKNICLFVYHKQIIWGKNFIKQFDLCVLLNDIFRRGSQKDVEI